MYLARYKPQSIDVMMYYCYCLPERGPDISAVSSTFKLHVEPGAPLGFSLPSAGVTCMGKPDSTSTRKLAMLSPEFERCRERCTTESRATKPKARSPFILNCSARHNESHLIQLHVPNNARLVRSECLMIACLQNKIMHALTMVHLMQFLTVVNECQSFVWHGQW